MKNDKGFGLVQLMVTIAVSSIVMYGTMSQFNYQMKSNTTYQALSDNLEFVNQIRNSIQDNVQASVMLAGNKAVVGPAKLYHPVLSPKILVQSGTKQQANDAWIVGNVNFDSVTATKTTGLYLFVISITINMDKKRTIGASAFKRLVGNAYCFVSANTITTCTGSVDPSYGATTQCKAIGGTWVATNVFGSQCVYPVISVSTRTGNDNGNHNGQDK